MNKLLFSFICALFVLFIFNLIKFFLENTYQNKLPEKYIEYSSKKYLQGAIFILAFVVSILIDEKKVIGLITSKTNISTINDIKNSLPFRKPNKENILEDVTNNIITTSSNKEIKIKN